MATAATGTTASGISYIGNPDYRGYLNYLGSNGDNTALSLLAAVGNDGVLANGGSPLNTDTINANDTYYANFLSGNKTGGATTTAPNTNAADLAYLDSQDQQLAGQKTSAEKALSDGLLQLEDSFNQTSNRTNQDKSTADQGYDTTRTNTTQDKLKGIDNLNTNARTLSDSVRRILSQAGGVNSTAFKYAAPQAIATDTTQKRTDVNDTFKRNFDSIDNSQAATDLKFQRALEDLGNQRKSKEEGLRSGILQQEQGIDSQLGQNALTRAEINGSGTAATSRSLAPIDKSISDRQAAIDNLFTQFRTPYTLQDTTKVDPTLGGYNTDPSAINANPTNQTTGADSTLSPYLIALQKKFQSPTATPAPVAA